MTKFVKTIEMRAPCFKKSITFSIYKEIPMAGIDDKSEKPDIYGDYYFAENKELKITAYGADAEELHDSICQSITESVECFTIFADDDTADSDEKDKQLLAEKREKLNEYVNFDAVLHCYEFNHFMLARQAAEYRANTLIQSVLEQINREIESAKSGKSTDSNKKPNGKQVQRRRQKHGKKRNKNNPKNDGAREVSKEQNSNNNVDSNKSNDNDAQSLKSDSGANDA